MTTNKKNTSEKMITTDECERCKYCHIEEESKARVYVRCDIKKRRYFYGQAIPCKYYEKK